MSLQSYRINSLYTISVLFSRGITQNKKAPLDTMLIYPNKPKSPAMLGFLCFPIIELKLECLFGGGEA